MSKLFYTYIYRDPSKDGEPIYVGKGCDKRAKIHLHRKDTGPFANRLAAMKRRSIHPDIEIIHALNEDHAKFMEICCISVLGRRDLGKGPLLNLTDGGEGNSGGIISTTHRKKISDALTGIERSSETKKKNSDSHKGKKHSTKTKEEMSKTRKGKEGTPLTDEAKKKLRNLNLGKILYKCSCLSCRREISITNFSRHLLGKECS